MSYLNLNKNDFDNINFLANYEDGDSFVLKNEKIFIDKQKEKIIQGDEKIAIILKNSIQNSISNLHNINKELSITKKIEYLTTVEKALKNYKLLGFDKIASLSQQEIEFLKHKEFLQEEVPFDPKEPSIHEELEQVRLALSKVNNPNLDNAIRATYLPQMTGAMTANGTYFVYGNRPSTQPSEEPISEPMFIAKPALQEAGAAKNSQGNVQTKDGIKGGEGAIRERLVYVGQKLLKVDCGIPPTVVVEEQNNFLSSAVDFEKINDSLATLRKINPKVTLTNFIELMKKGYSVEKIIDVIGSQTTTPATPFEVALQETILKLKKDGTKITYAQIVKELKPTLGMIKIQENVAKVKDAVVREDSLEELNKAVRTLWTQLLLPTAEKGMMSMQQFVPNCRSLGSLSMAEQDELPVEEIHKLFIDFIFFNTDRHLHNILVNIMGTSQPLLVLIDHGSCLPRPLEKEDCKGLKQARYEFLELPQCNQPLHSKFANVIKDLDIEQFISSLKEDQAYHKEFFGELCHVPEECYNLIRLNLHILKAGVEMGATLKEIGSLHQITNSSGTISGGSIVDIYTEFIANKEKIDWIEIKNKCKMIFKKV